MRRPWRAWLLSVRSLRACLQIALAAAVETEYRRTLAAANASGIAAVVVRIIEVVLLLYPLVYFVIPLLSFAVTWILTPFARERPAYPCPVCGYDIRETPHRCPECGTKLRWGSCRKKWVGSACIPGHARCESGNTCDMLGTRG